MQVVLTFWDVLGLLGSCCMSRAAVAGSEQWELATAFEKCG